MTQKRTRHIDLLYHEETTIDMVESMTFEKPPEKIIHKKLIGKLLAKGIELWYVDGRKVVRYI